MNTLSTVGNKTLLFAATLFLLLSLTFVYWMAVSPTDDLYFAGMPALDADSKTADWEAPVCAKRCTAGMPALDADSTVAYIDDGEAPCRCTDRSNITG